MASPTEEAARHLRRTVLPLLETPANDEQWVRLLDAISKEVAEERRAAERRLEVCFF